MDISGKVNSIHYRLKIVMTGIVIRSFNVATMSHLPRESGLVCLLLRYHILKIL